MPFLVDSVRMSLARAKFCEQISNLRKDKENPPKAFLTGLLSMIDGIMNIEIAPLLDILPVHNDIKIALKGEKSPLFYYLELARKTEQGEWAEAERIVKALKIPSVEYYNAHSTAIEWADEMMLTQQKVQ